MLRGQNGAANTFSFWGSEINDPTNKLNHWRKTLRYLYVKNSNKRSMSDLSLFSRTTARFPRHGGCESLQVKLRAAMERLLET